MALLADELRDLAIDTDRQVFIDDDGDLAQTSGIQTVQQSVAIEAGSVLRPLVGNPLTTEILEDVTTELTRILQQDPQIDDVHRVEVTEINQQDNKVSISVFVGNNNEFDLEVDV